MNEDFNNYGLMDPDHPDPEVQAILEKLPKLSDLVEAQREAEATLAQVDAALEEMNVSMIDMENERKRIEGTYLLKIDLLYFLAKTFHPLTTYGMSFLSRAKKTREEFDEFCGPMITRIKLENLKVFRHVLSKDLMETIAAGKVQAIGALRLKDGELYGAGALAYTLDENPMDGSAILRYTWLYVDPDFRGMSIGNFLIGEMMSQVAELGMSGATVDISVLDDPEQKTAKLFDTWRFQFTSGVTPEVRVKLSDIANSRHLKMFSGKVLSIRQAGIDKNLFIKRFLAKSAYSGYLTGGALPSSYIDGELSCFTGTPINPEAVLLAHRCPSGKLSVELCDGPNENEKIFARLICRFAAVASTRFKPDTMLEFTLPSDEVGGVMDKIFPEQLGAPLLEGVITRPEPDNDFTMEEAEIIFSLEPEELDSLMAGGNQQ